MFTKSKIAITAAVILAAASASMAKDSSSPPTIDVGTTCRENAIALGTLFGNDTTDAVEVCKADEQAARDELAKDWASYPAVAKARCVQTKEYLPGYVEWLACIQMTRDVLQLRKEDVGATPAEPNIRPRSRGHRASSNGRECPIVNMAGDGSISYIINC